jgi:hypothetical protein
VLDATLLGCQPEPKEALGEVELLRMSAQIRDACLAWLVSKVGQRMITVMGRSQGHHKVTHLSLQLDLMTGQHCEAAGSSPMQQVLMCCKGKTDGILL